MLGLHFKKDSTPQERPHYGRRQIVNARHAKDGFVQCITLENFTLPELIAHLESSRARGGLNELLDRYNPRRTFPDLGNFRLGPNAFGLTALDWIVFVEVEADAAKSSLVAHGVTTRITWNGDPESLPRGWTGSVRQSYERSVLDSEAPNTLVGLFIFAETAYREHGWAAEVADAMKRLAIKSNLQSLIIPLRLPTRYEWQNARLPYEQFALQKREDGQFQDHWLRMHVRLGAEVMGVSEVSHQHALHPDDLRAQFQCDMIDSSGSYVVKSHDEYYAAFVDLKREAAIINEGCVWVRYSLSRPETGQ
jgi:hypothetical protein